MVAYSCRVLCLFLISISAVVLIAKESFEDFNELSLEELLNININVASNVVTDEDKQPVSIYKITQDQIQLSAARTLNELIMIYVPGFFLVEDQDDVIAAFRGFSPDNNSKVLLLLNGHNINTEWFWGPSDSILNGIDLDYIKEIQVIRGPGSVTLGQGALLGVINILTHNATDTGVRLFGTGGESGSRALGIQANLRRDELAAMFYVSSREFDGEPMRNEGWAADRVENGLSVFDREHGLKRSDNTTVIASIQYKNFDFNILYAQQTRDLYNFFRDREEVGQELTSFSANWRHEFNEKYSMRLKLGADQDDFELYSHRGLVMGGTRENRFGGQAFLNINGLFQGNKMAIGAEFKRFDSGKLNESGNNFIINTESTRLADVNANNRWVYPNETDLFSVLFESYQEVNEKLTLFGAFRFDDHPDWGSQVSPRLGALYTVRDNLNLRFTYQTGFRGAVGVAYAGGFQSDGLMREENFSQIQDNAVLNSLGYTNLPETNPEEMESFELAINWDNGNGLEVNAVTFYNEMENILDVGVIFVGEDLVGETVGSDIAGDWGGFWFFKNNEGNISQYGAELQARYDAEKFNLGFSHALVRVDSVDSGNLGTMYIAGTQDSPHFRAYPEDVSRLHLTWRASESFTIGYNHLYYFDWWSPTNIEADGNHIGGLNLRYAFLEKVSASLHVKNVWDSDELYPMNNNAGNEDLTDGTPALEERSVWVKLSVNF
jgi:outer membrane receptor for ferrienterochelin and colicin